MRTVIFVGFLLIRATLYDAAKLSVPEEGLGCLVVLLLFSMAMDAVEFVSKVSFYDRFSE